MAAPSRFQQESSGGLQRSSPITAAGPSPILTGFPIKQKSAPEL